MEDLPPVCLIGEPAEPALKLCRASDALGARASRDAHASEISGDALLSARATLGRVVLSRPRNGPAGLVHRFERDLHDRAGILDQGLEALSDKTALDSGEILNRPAMSQLAQALKVALELLLSQAVPFTRGILIGLGQHGAELRDRFHVLPGLPGKPFAIVPGEAQRACELIRGILEPLRGRIDAALHGFPGVLCRLLAEVGQLYDPGPGGIAVLAGLPVSLLACSKIRHLFFQSGVLSWERRCRSPPRGCHALTDKNP